jgi:small conductance mechanosensitive channel
MDSMNIEETTSQIVSFLSVYGLQVVGAILILIVGRIAAGILAGATKRGLVKAHVDPALVSFLTSLVRIGVLAFAIIAALKKFGVETTSFVAVLGAAGLAIGLALQGSLSNFAAGVLLLIFKPFKIGDYVEAGGTAGAVREIGIFTSTFHTPDNKKVIIPNAQITGGIITNYSANDTRRVDLVAGIGYGDDMGKAKEVLERILGSHPLVLDDPAPVIEVGELGDSSVNLLVRPWVKTSDYWRVYWDVTRAIKEEFDKEGISIPFPQRDVHLYQASN